MTTLQALITLVTLGWALISWTRGHRATALASATMSLVSAAAWWASATQFTPWIEGGYGMHVLAVVGGYAIGSAVAGRVSGKSAPRLASVIGLVLVGVLTAAFFREGMALTEEAVKDASPEDAATILRFARGELMRLVELSGVIGAIAALFLLLPRKRSGQKLEERLERERSVKSPNQLLRA
jgi:hypothetical protein